MPEEIDEADLLAVVASAGETPPTSEQLKGWRRAGLMPGPRIEHAVGVRGSRALYPAWAAEQLVAAMRLHRSTHRLGDLSVALWWEGHWIEPRALRKVLAAPLERMSRDAEKARAGEEDPYESADAVLASLKDSGASSGASALFRKRLSRHADFLDVLWTLLVIAAGGQAPWEEEDLSLPDPAPGALQLLARATGVDRAMSDDPMGNGSWLPADFDLPKFMADLRDAGGFELADAAYAIRDASDAELAQARDDALLFSRLTMIGSTLESLLGDDVGGLGALSTMVCTTTFDRAAMVRNMLILRGLVGSEAFSAIAQLVEQQHPRYVAIAQLRAALPQHEEILRVDVAHRLAALPPPQAEKVREDITSYLLEHPQVAAALSNEQQAPKTPRPATGDGVLLTHSQA
jgi:hypothetical protein